MSAQTEMLGGRLPLLDPATLSTAQKETYEQLDKTWLRWAKGVFQGKLDDGRLIGPFNPILFSPAISSSFLDFQVAEKNNTSLSQRVRELVILAVGTVWKSNYNLYAHAAAARKVGISDDAIRALTTGGVPDDLNDQEKIAYRFARQLSAERRIDPVLYDAAEHAFGQRGLVEITYLIGEYQTVCALLNAFEIPAPGSQITEHALNPRLSLVDPDNTSAELAQAFKLLPAINVFRALANAETLYR
jgi:4-carboxymuconolactone decarboxylase